MYQVTQTGKSVLCVDDDPGIRGHTPFCHPLWFAKSNGHIKKYALNMRTANEKGQHLNAAPINYREAV